MDPTRERTPIVIATLVAAGASLLIAGVLVWRGLMVMVFASAYPTDRPPWVDAAYLLLSGAMLCCLVAVGSVLIGAFRRSPVPYLVASLVLAAATGLLAGPEISVWRQPDLPAIWNWTELPAWTVPVGIGCALLTLVTAWVMRLETSLARRTRITLVALAAIAIFLAAGYLSATTMSTAVIDAPDEAAAAICPELDGSLVFWIQRSLRAPDVYVRGARIERSPANPLHQFVVAELHGTGYEDDGDVGVWLIDKSTSGPRDPTSDPAPPIYAINALAFTVSTLPSKLMPDASLGWLEDCTREMQRVVSGM